MRDIGKKTDQEIFESICKQLWLNEDYPKNMNIYLSSVHSQYIKVIDDNKVISIPRNTGYERALEVILKIFKDKINNFIRNNKEDEQNIDRLNKIYKNFETNTRKYRKDFFTILSNDSEIVKIHLENLGFKVI
jgi:hypothetical protein